jgi:outer membrane biosynthesis protein TonB
MRALWLAIVLAACGGETAPVVAPIATNAPADASSPAASAEPSAEAPIPSAPSTSGVPTDGGLCSEKCRGRATPDLVNGLTLRAQQTRRCYNRALGNDPKIRGDMRILVVVARDGSTCDQRITESTLPAEMGECVLNTFRGQSYSPPVDGCIDVTIPLRFEPATLDAGAPVVP